MDESAEEKSLLSRPLQVIAAIVIFILAVLIGTSLFGSRDEKQIEKLIKAGREAVINKDLKTCLTLLHNSYADNLGHDYNSISGYMNYGFTEVSDIEVKIRNLEIKVGPGKNSATAEFEILFKGKVDDGLGRKVPFAGIQATGNPLQQPWELVSLKLIRPADSWLISRLELTAPTK